MPPPRSWTSTSPSIPRCSAGTQRSGRDRQYSAGSWFPTSRPLGPPPEPDLRPDRRNAMGAPSPELCNLWLARAFNAQDLDAAAAMYHPDASRSEEHTSELQSLMRLSYAVSCLEKKKYTQQIDPQLSNI